MVTACILCKVVRGIQVVVEVASALQCCNTVQQAVTAAATTARMGEKIEIATITVAAVEIQWHSQCWWYGVASGDR